VLGAGVDVTECALESATLADRGGFRPARMRPLGGRPCRVGGVHRGHPHIGAQLGRQVVARVNLCLCRGKGIDHQQPSRPPGSDVVGQTLLEGLTAGQRGHIAHPHLGGREFLDIASMLLATPRANDA